MMNQPTTQKGQQVVASESDEWADIRLRDDHIAEVHLRPRGYNRNTVSGIIDKIRSLQDHNQLLVLILAHPDSSIDLSGIKGLFSRKSLSYSVAKAYVIHKPVHFLLAKACLALYRPRMPIRFFKRREEAEAWLGCFVGYGI
jgi:hypothetical protein